MIPGSIPEQDITGAPTGTILEFECSTQGTKASTGYPIYGPGGAVSGQCGNRTYDPEMSCKTENKCGIGGAECTQFDNAISGNLAYAALPPNYTPSLVTAATQVPFDGTANSVTFGALNNVVTDVEEFGNECIHKHLVPFNQDPHTFVVKTQPAYIPGGNITSTINIDVNAENKADGYIQPFLVQEFLIKY